MKIRLHQGMVLASLLISNFSLPQNAFAQQCHFFSIADDFLNPDPTKLPKGFKWCSCDGDQMTGDGYHSEITYWAYVPHSFNCSSCSFFNTSLWDRQPITLSCNDLQSSKKRSMNVAPEANRLGKSPK